MTALRSAPTRSTRADDVPLGPVSVTTQTRSGCIRSAETYVRRPAPTARRHGDRLTLFERRAPHEPLHLQQLTFSPARRSPLDSPQQRNIVAIRFSGATFAPPPREADALRRAQPVLVTVALTQCRAGAPCVRLRRSCALAPPPISSILLSRLKVRGPTKPRWLYAGIRPAGGPARWPGCGAP